MRPPHLKKWSHHRPLQNNQYIIETQSNEIPSHISLTNETYQTTKKIREAIERSEDKYDEEQRVWYVGVTRTKQNLYILTAKYEDKGYDIESLG